MILETSKISLHDHRMTSVFIQQLEAARKNLDVNNAFHTNMGTITRALRRIQKKLERPLRIAIIGELNAGKTSLANVLIGDMTLPTRAIPNTRFPTLIHYSARPQVSVIFSNGLAKTVCLSDIGGLENIARLDVGIPNEHLQHLEILDCWGLSDPHITPSDFNISSYHVDAALWCTSSIGPWRKSEQDSWRSLPQRIKDRSILVVTRKDLLDKEGERKILSRLHVEVDEIFRDILLLSSTQALDAYTSPNPYEMWKLSGAEELAVKLAKLISHIRMHRLETAKALTIRISQRILAKF